MNKIAVLVVLAAFLPNVVMGLDCSSNGYSVVFVNGVLNDQEKADISKAMLEERFKFLSKQDDISFYLGHNQSHLGGLADFTQSVSQMLENPISYYDRDTILRQVHSEVTTRKILLVGHSQGTFYTNEIFKYLIEHGVSRESIGVYNLAAPASYVAGGGGHLTSKNDQLVLRVRKVANSVDIPEPLQPNITIPISDAEVGTMFGGHSFGGAYLACASRQIVQDIEKTLATLKVTNTSTADECFKPPPETLSYKMQDVSFKVLDPVSNIAVNTVSNAEKALVAATKKAYAAASSAAAAFTNALVNIVKTQPKVSAASQGAAAAGSFTQSPPPTTPQTPKPKPLNSPTAPKPLAISLPTPPAPPPTLPPVAPETIPPAVSPEPAPTPPAPPHDTFAQQALQSVGGSPTQSPPPTVVLVPLAVSSPSDGASYATSSATFTGTTTAGFVA